MAITFLNSTAATIATAASTWSIQPNSSIEGGAGFVLGFGLASTAVSVSTVTDNAGNVYRRAVAAPGTKVVGAEMWYATNISSASTRISVTLSGNSTGTIGLLQARGISTGSPLSGTASSNVTANSTVWSAGEFTPTRANCIAVSYELLSFSTAGTITNQGGMTTWVSTTSTGAPRTHGMYIIQGAASTVSGSFTTSSRGFGSGVIAAFSDTSVLGGTRFRGRTLLGVGR